MTYPYDDEYLKYDYDTHRYILTEKAVLDKGNINLQERLNVGGVANAERAVNTFLKQISNLVYKEIYRYHTQWTIAEYQIAKCPSARNVIMEAMLDQVDYVLLNGFINQYGGIDFKKGQKMQNVEDRYLAPLAKDILTNPLIETKVPLIYAGNYAMIFMPDYEKMGY